VTPKVLATHHASLQIFSRLLSEQDRRPEQQGRVHGVHPTC